MHIDIYIYIYICIYSYVYIYSDIGPSRAHIDQLPKSSYGRLTLTLTLTRVRGYCVRVCQCMGLLATMRARRPPPGILHARHN